MNWILCGVLCGLAGGLAWIGLELRAVRKTLQARWDYDRLTAIRHLLPEKLYFAKDSILSLRGPL